MIAVLVGVGVAVAYGFGLGFLLGSIRPPQHKQEITLTMQIQLDATQDVKITASAKDAEGNAVDLSGAELKLQATATEGDFGTINDDMDTFTPGAAGALGTITGAVEINGQTYEASVDVELVPGAPATFALEFQPVS